MGIFKGSIRPVYRRITLFLLRLSWIGDGVYVNHRVRVKGARKISLGNDVHVHYGSELVVVGDGNLQLGDGCRIGPNAWLHANSGTIEMGKNVYVGPQSILRGDGGLRIGNDVLISPQVIIMSANHNYRDRSIPIREQGESFKGIVIEDDVWIGAGVKIMDGVTVARGAVVAAGAVVTRDVAPYTVVAGVPARVIGQRE